MSNTRKLYQVPILLTNEDGTPADKYVLHEFYEDSDGLAVKRLRMARQNMGQRWEAVGEPIRVERRSDLGLEASDGEFVGVAFTRNGSPYCGCTTPGRAMTL